LFILGINGSANSDGSTAYLLKEALTTARDYGAETELLHAAEILNDIDTPFCELCSASCFACG
jgi:multimeric flavodoxin WrbA